MTAPRADPGLQRRSRETFERIIATTEQLLDGRDWASVTVEEICIEADVSASSFYRRFPTKDSLLAEIHRRWLDNRSRAITEMRAAFPWDDMTTDQMIEVLAWGYIADRAEHSALATSMFRVQVTHPELEADRARNDRDNLFGVADELSERLDRPLEDVRFALLVVTSGIVAAKQPPVPFVETLGWDDAQLAQRFAGAFRRLLDL